ncbi:MAG TPA: SDR family oxidoreductase [Pyrinomonadaceae bacterium]|nr:SDR family oxidoreductase [Pyrinomonadaceae bacterium]HMP64445.1 SDR family oxidoreductase [Pyrinomonadaceae bacterium]
MKLLILGASGLTGRELVKQALAAGHEVTAFVRDPAKLDIRSDQLRVEVGNILNRISLETAIPGHDAVLSALGSPGLGKSTELSDGLRNIIDVMELNGPKRLIFESGIGIGDSAEHVPWFTKHVFIPFVIKNIYADKEIQERQIRESSLDWTIVRPAALTNGPRTGVYRHGDAISKERPAKKISRADTAEFMLRQLDDDTYLHKTPGLSY